jgi:alanyl-tRNA synthetase
LRADDIRSKFLEFFVERGHTIVPSSSLVPQDDPTLLFTNAGMVQFKDVFLGISERPYSRAVTVQKCLRAGGKHNDLESVGKTARHQTFFEMLGNFSFGDYFKREAIDYCWQFLTGVLGLDPVNLWITVYHEDEEASRLWKKVAGVSPDRIVRLGEKDNFWSMGETGPCGPCSEVIIDRGMEHRCNAPRCAIGECDCDRWLELWNLVFMQYQRDQEGLISPLPNPSIDTGMGLERIASVMQGVSSTFETDLLKPLITYTEELSSREFFTDERGFGFKVIADHAKACTFLISEGVLPSNEGRGYVLRRILRRAVRFGRTLGIDEPFLHLVAGKVVDMMGKAYPELKERRNFVARVVKSEEERFVETLYSGLKIAEEMADQTIKQGHTVLSGADAFKLYDTYGFPLDLTMDLAAERGLKVDREGFDRAMDEQRKAARLARETTTKGVIEETTMEFLHTCKDVENSFVGYKRLKVKTKVLALGEDGRAVSRIFAGDEGDAGQRQQIALLLDEVPFYPGGGGQEPDKGTVSSESGSFTVEGTETLHDGRIVVYGRLEQGTLAVGDEVLALVDEEHRMATARNHTATHLLHRALKKVLGDHVNQAGSLVSAKRLRFDFTHFDALTEEEFLRIEEMVNVEILRDSPVSSKETGLREAIDQGAVALFGEKYQDRVRVVSIGKFSKELCGGTHVKRTVQIGPFVIVHEGSVGSGLRRIEALTGSGALTFIQENRAIINDIASKMRVETVDIPDRLEELFVTLKDTQKLVDQMKSKALNRQASELSTNPRMVDDVKVAIGEVDAGNMENLRQAGDLIRNKIGSGIVVIGARSNEKALLLAMVTSDITKRGFHAGKIVKEAAKEVDGSGGGRAEMAQAGGKDPSGMPRALDRAFSVITGADNTSVKE